jgi:hypothetical protein
MKYLHIILIAAGLSLLQVLAHAETIELPANRGGYIISELDGSNPRFISPVDTQINFIGAMGAGGARQVIIGFDLPDLNGRFINATIEFRMRDTDAVSSFPWFNIDAYAFTHEPTEKDSYLGPDDRSKTRVGSAIMNNHTQDGELISIDLSPFLRPLYVNGKPTVETLFIRLNPDDPDGDLSTGDLREGNFGRYRPIIITGANTSEALLRMTTE